MVDDRLGAERSDGGTEAVGHHHEYTLRTAADLLVRVLVDEERTADVEEVEGHTVNDHRKNEEHEAEARRAARTEEEETQSPSHKGNEHHLLDAEFLQEERDQKNTKRFRDLRYGRQEHVVFHCKGVGVFRRLAKGIQEWGGEAVGHL